jgi:protein TonB
MENRAYHWLIALMFAALFHAAVALALVRKPPPEVTRIVAIAIELEPGGGSNGGQAGTGDDGDGVEPAINATENERIEQMPDLRDELERDPNQTQDSVAEVEPAPTADVVPPVSMPEPAVVKAPAPNPKVAEKPKPEPKFVQKPGPKPRPAPKPPAERTAEPKAAGKSQAGSGGSDLVTRGEGSGSGTDMGSGSGKGKGSANRQARYYGELVTWLNRHKRYPAAARRSRHTGTVRVTFTIDRNGRVLSKRIVSSSGHAALDNEVEAMLRRASPMPRIPRELGRSTLTVTLPVVFTLR